MLFDTLLEEGLMPKKEGEEKEEETMKEEGGTMREEGEGKEEETMKEEGGTMREEGGGKENEGEEGAKEGGVQGNKKKV